VACRQGPAQQNRAEIDSRARRRGGRDLARYVRRREVILSAATCCVPTSAARGKVLVSNDRQSAGLSLCNWDMTEVGGGLAQGDRVVVSLDRPEVKAGARARVAEVERR
jgi:HlyD family secretion protein